MAASHDEGGEGRGHDDYRQDVARCAGQGQDRDGDDHQPLQQAGGHEQAQRIVEITQAIEASAPFRAQTERQAHQRGECGLHRANVDGSAGEQEKQKRHEGERGGDHAIPPRRRRRRSKRAMRPLSRSWS